MKAEFLKKQTSEMNRIFKIWIFIFGIFFILFISVYKYYCIRFERNLNAEGLTDYISEINKSKELPNNFYSAYEMINPKSTENNLIHSIFQKSECQSLKVSGRISNIVKKQQLNRRENLIFGYFLTKKIEKNTTQKQCLTWTANQFDFLYNIKGIENASEFYFRKKIRNLDADQLLTLIRMMENPVKNNPLRK